LKKDEHPNPPLRALPEHSVLEEHGKGTSHVLLSGGSSPHGLDGIANADGSADSQMPGAFPGTLGIAQKDFVGASASINSAQQSRGPAPDVRSSGSGRLFAPGGFTSGGDKAPTSQQLSSKDFTSGSTSTFGQNFSSSVSQDSNTAQHSSSPHHSLSTGHQVQAGKMTFTVPDFGENGAGEAAPIGDDVLSPTQSRQ